MRSFELEGEDPDEGREVNAPQIEKWPWMASRVVVYLRFPSIQDTRVRCSGYRRNGRTNLRIK